MGLINWKEQKNFYGLDYSTKYGAFKDFTFDIRYDYDGDPSLIPKCKLHLTIYFKSLTIMSYRGDIESLTNKAEDFMNNFLNQYQR